MNLLSRAPNKKSCPGLAHAEVYADWCTDHLISDVLGAKWRLKSPCGTTAWPGSRGTTWYQSPLMGLKASCGEWAGLETRLAWRPWLAGQLGLKPTIQSKSDSAILSNQILAKKSPQTSPQTDTNPRMYSWLSALVQYSLARLAP